MNRRSFVTATAATLGSIGLAGCTGGGDGEGGGQFTSGTTVSAGTTTVARTGTGTADRATTTAGGIAGIGGTVENDSPYVEVTDHSVFETSDAVGVSGLVVNTSDRLLEYVEVEVTVLDGDTVIGEFVDTSDLEIDYLAAGMQWRFWVTFGDAELAGNASYTISVEAEASDPGGATTETTATTGTTATAGTTATSGTGATTSTTSTSGDSGQGTTSS